MYLCLEASNSGNYKGISIVSDNAAYTRKDCIYNDLTSVLNTYHISDAHDLLLIQHPLCSNSDLQKAMIEHAANYLCGYYCCPKLYNRMVKLLYNYISLLSYYELKAIYPYFVFDNIPTNLEYFN